MIAAAPPSPTRDSPTISSYDRTNCPPASGPPPRKPRPPFVLDHLGKPPAEPTAALSEPEHAEVFAGTATRVHGR